MGRTARIADALMDQATLVVAWLQSLPYGEFARPSVVHGHTVKDLVEHNVYVLGDLTATLNQPSTSRPVPLATYLRHVRQRRLDIEHLHEGTDTPERLVTQLETAVDEVLRLLRRTSVPDLVGYREDSVRTIDVLRVATLGTVRAADDLTLSVPTVPGPQLVPSALAESSRLLAEVLSTRFPGQSIEVRVPPHAAVQVSDGSGPTHTRGTPPSVVEMAPRTFLRLGTGRQTFQEAVDTHLVQASGAHCDLSEMLPIIPA